ncbi:MAG: hypothetical protein HUK09_03360 [Bacteroidaceae bacterium]|nr:hypothetical protein [Bacteroidaceae bacterium]
MATITLQMPNVMDFAAATRLAKELGGQLIGFTNEPQSSDLAELLAEAREGEEQIARGECTTFDNSQAAMDFLDSLPHKQ